VLRLSFAAKLRLALLWPAVAALAVAALLLLWILPTRFERMAASELLETTALIEPLVAQRIESDPHSLPKWARDLAGSSELRLTVIDAGGRVLADSSRTDAELARMDNHAGRPEVRMALVTGSGTSVRRSATTGVAYAYAARTLDLSGGRGRLVVRLAAPIHTLGLLERQLRQGSLLAVLAALAATAAVSWWVGRRLFRPLAELVAGADRFSSGEPGYRVALAEETELAALATALNRLAEHAETQLSSAERERDQLRSVLASMAEGVLVTDGQGRALLVNPAFTRLFGTRSAVAGMLPIELAREPQLQSLVTATLEHGGSSSADLILDRGDRRHVALIATPLGGHRGVVVVARDITPFIRLTEMRRDFVANVSHELKTPLAAIRGMAETLRDGALGDVDTAERFVGRILVQCSRLEALLEDLLTLSRLESPTGVAEPQPVELATLAHTAAEVVGPRARERDVVLEVDADDTVIPGDADALERLLINLLDNAVKYNHPGGAVRLAVRGRPTEVGIEVRDTGIGIPPEHLPRIFERFYRVDRARSGEGGTGLGLAIVKHVAQLHGGRVAVTSEPGAGSTFTVTLPRS
jgi:two-component system phosphate regulon sensor histidine kinase PhoR